MTAFYACPRCGAELTPIAIDLEPNYRDGYADPPAVTSAPPDGCDVCDLAFGADQAAEFTRQEDAAIAAAYTTLTRKEARLPCMLRPNRPFSASATPPAPVARPAPASRGWRTTARSSRSRRQPRPPRRPSRGTTSTCGTGSPSEGP